MLFLTKMPKKYLEVNSSSRNRNLWPHPAEFDFVVERSGSAGNGATALDPVCVSQPIIAFSGYRFNANMVDVNIKMDVITTGIGESNSSNIIIVEENTSEVLQTKTDYYRHAVLFRSQGGDFIRTRISSYRYLGNDRGKLILEDSISPADGDKYEIVDPTDLSVPEFAFIFVPAGSNIPNDYTSYIIYNETLDEFRKIINYDTDMGSVTPGLPAIPTWENGHNYSIRIAPPSGVTVAAVGSDIDTIILTDPNLVVNVGDFVRIPETLYLNQPVAPQSESRRVVAVDGNTLTIHPDFTADPTGLKIEILEYSYDNFNPFTYTGTRENTMVNYNVKLSSLILPNQLLDVGLGGRISYYPYVYVEFSPVEGQAQGVIYSNNSSAKRALFTSAVGDIQNLETALFVKLTGDDMIQTIKFKTDTTFHFKITLPNGQLFKTAEIDTTNPSAVIPTIQINAVIEVERVGS